MAQILMRSTAVATRCKALTLPRRAKFESIRARDKRSRPACTKEHLSVGAAPLTASGPSAAALKV